MKNWKDIRIVFMGSPDFAKESLKALNEEFNVTLVVSQEDKPRGRKMVLTPTPVKEEALKLNIPCITPKNLKKDREAIETIKKENPDFLVVVAYGQILSKEVLDIPKYCPINLHASLLPLLRGAAPIQAAVLSGMKETGNTTMIMAEGLDTGDMLLKNIVKIDPSMTYGQLHDELMYSGAKLLAETIKKFSEGKIIPEKQDDTEATYIPKLEKKDFEVDFKDTTENILNKIRGFNPYPLAHTFHDGKRIKLVKAEKGDLKGEEGKILKADVDGIEVGTKDGSVRLIMIKPEGRKEMDIRTFLNGNALDINVKFTGSENI